VKKKTTKTGSDTGSVTLTRDPADPTKIFDPVTLWPEDPVPTLLYHSYIYTLTWTVLTDEPRSAKFILCLFTRVRSIALAHMFVFPHRNVLPRE